MQTQLFACMLQKGPYRFRNIRRVEPEGVKAFRLFLSIPCAVGVAVRCEPSRGVYAPDSFILLTQQKAMKKSALLEKQQLLCYNHYTSYGLNIFIGACFLKNLNLLEIVL